MSRSRKKTPVFKDNSVYKKRLANKKVRRSDVNSGSNYKKLYQSWNISDWAFMRTLTEEWEFACTRYIQESYMTVKNRWAKYYLRK